MKFWDYIRHYFYRRALADRLSRVAVKHALINLADAKAVGILYDSTAAGNDVAIARFAAELRHQGKDVAILGYVNDTKTEHKADITLFNRKQVNWARVPGGEKVEQFANKNFDLLLSCFATPNAMLEYISYISQAKWRVGAYAPDKTQCYDMMINVGERKEVEYLVEQTVYFLNQIKYDTN